MFSTGRLSSEVPYPFIYHFSRKRYPFRAESPRKGHYRESPGWAHTSTHVIRTWIRLLANAKIKKIIIINVLTQYRGAPLRSSLTVISRYLVAHFPSSCRGSEIIALLLPCLYWNRIKFCVVARLTGLFERCFLFCIWRFFTLHNGCESSSLAQLPRGESK